MLSLLEQCIPLSYCCLCSAAPAPFAHLTSMRRLTRFRLVFTCTVVAALISASRRRTKENRECVAILLEAGVTASGVSFNALCDDPSLGRYTKGVPLETLHRKLLVRTHARKHTCSAHVPSLDSVVCGVVWCAQNKLGVRSLEELNPFRTVVEEEVDVAPQSGSVKSGASLHWCSRKSAASLPLGTAPAEETTSSGGSRTLLTPISALHRTNLMNTSGKSKSQRWQSRTDRWQPRMVLNELYQGWEHALGFFVLEELAGVHFRAHLRARSRIGGHCLEPSFTDLSTCGRAHLHTHKHPGHAALAGTVASPHARMWWQRLTEPETFPRTCAIRAMHRSWQSCGLYSWATLISRGCYGRAAARRCAQR
jgi:hypothetical protein